MDCPDDATLARLIEGVVEDVERARLLAHVEVCDSCHAMIAAASAEDDPRRALRTGDEIGRYRVVGLIGAGGMGAVYRAHDRELARDVALKVIRSDVVGDAATLRERLRGEARALAKVTSPYVVAVYEVGELGNPSGDLFLAMELVDGPTLRGWLSTPRTTRELAAMFASCARGLAAAHDAGVVHRDFKPDNVIVGADGRPRIGDFGLAASLGNGSPEIAGTLPYLAPEVRRGGVATAASDQWSLCVALAEAVLGRRPEHDLAGLPAPIRKVVALGLQHDPLRRATSLHAVADALQAIASPRSRAWIGVVGLVALGAIAGTYVVMRERGATCELAPASALWSPAERDATSALFRSVLPERGAVVFEALDHGVAAWSARWDSERSAACRDQPRLSCLELQHRRVGAVLRLLATADAALVERAPELAATLPDPAACLHAPAAPAEVTPVRTELEVKLVEARALFDVGRFTDAGAAAAAVLDAATRAGETSVALRARVLRGFALRDSNQNVRAAEDFRASVALAIERGEDYVLADALIGLADTQVMSGDLAGHEIAVDTAAGAVAKLGHDPELEARLARSRCRIASRRPTQLDRGVRDCEEARRLYIAFRGPDAPEIAHVENNLGIIAYMRGHYDEASRHFAAFGELSRKYHGDSFVNVDTARVNQAETLVRVGKLDEAEALYRILEVRRPKWSSVWDGQGAMYRRRGDRARAKAMFEKAAEVAAAEAIGECAERISVAEVALELPEDARPVVARAIAVCGQVTGMDQARLELVRSRLAAAEHDTAAARTLAVSARALADAQKPLAGSPDDEVRSEILRWQASLP